METRCIYPYIYFFGNPVVFVFKIKSEKYIIPSQLKEAGECKVYELKKGEEFAAFDHEKASPVTGAGYFISEEGIAFMTKEVNRQIVNHKKASSISSAGSFQDVDDLPVHLVASESTASSLRVALESPKKVIGFPDYLTVGPIGNLHTKDGQDARFEWLYDHINSEMNEYDQEINFTNTLIEIDEIPKHVPIYIWYGNNSEEQTALRFFLYLLADKTNDIFLIHINEHNDIKHTHISMFDDKELKILFEYKQKKGRTPLSNEEKINYIEEWMTLAKSKEVLRIWQENKIGSVSEQYFDSIILKVIKTLHEKQENKEFIRVSAIIGETIDQLEEYMSDSFIEYRIRDLVYSGILKMKGIPKSMRHYRVMLSEG
ncbi:DUF1835 domain-containing protein [Niallia sp. 03190]|uniref:DUF1835 domain-containing protein n=1 Tax=Niallia sp. 03190 TaxID=3458061 RepID=UPI004044D4DA